MGDVGLLNQEEEPGVTINTDIQNGFNDITCLVMIWKVIQIWAAESWFASNFCNYHEELLLHQTRNDPIILLIRYGVTQGHSLYIVLYSNTLTPLA